MYNPVYLADTLLLEQIWATDTHQRFIPSLACLATTAMFQPCGKAALTANPEMGQP
ncbi:hypothetical protein D3C76_1632940 [compost metagenome]